MQLIDLIEFISSHGDNVTTTGDKITMNSEILQGIDFIISYGYKYILKPDILDRFPHRAINIHISWLPWNRGVAPNFFSFLENTPKGVTIHYLDAGIDTGDILVQREVNFSPEETLRTSYEKLSQTALALFKDSWLTIRSGKIQGTPQPPGGSYHGTREFARYEPLLTQGWETPVALIPKLGLG